MGRRENMGAAEIRIMVVQPVLQYLHPEVPYSLAAENLLIGTAAQESRFKYNRQLGNGPAKSIFQIEPATWNWIVDEWLEAPSRAALKEKIDRLSLPWHTKTETMEQNLQYACAVARLVYRARPNPLPDDPYDVQALGEAWKVMYNTHMGAGTVLQFTQSWQRHVA